MRAIGRGPLLCRVLAVAFLVAAGGCGEEVTEVVGTTTLPGPLVLDRQEQVDHLRGLQRIVGTLTVGGANPTDVRDLSPLASLESVESITIVGCPDLSSVSLPNLHSVETLTISDCAGLTRLGSFGSLREVGGLHLIRLARFLDLSGLEALRVAEELTLSGLGALQSLRGLDSIDSVGTLEIVATGLSRLDVPAGSLGQIESLVIEDNDALRSLAGLEAIPTKEQDGTLMIRGNPNLVDLEGLHTFTRGGEILLIDLPALEKLDGLRAFGEIRRLRIESCGKLEDLSGLTALRRIGELELVASPALRSFAHLEGLVECETLHLVEMSASIDYANSTLPPVQGLVLAEMPSTAIPEIAFADTMDAVILDDNPRLANLSALAGVRELERLSITECPQLQSLAPLSAVRISGRVSLAFNRGLPNLEGLEGITSLRESLGIYENDSFVSFSGLQNLTRVEGNVVIQENRTLCRSVASAWLSGVEVLGTVRIGDNADCLR